MATKTQQVIDRIAELANDPAFKQLKLVDIARGLNEGQQAIAAAVPRSAASYVVLTLAAGAKQDLRAIDATKRWLRLHRLVCNAPGGVPSGDTILAVDQSAVDAAVRGWRGATPAAAVLEYGHYEADPCVFDVYPPVQAGTKVQAHVTIAPPTVAVLNGAKTALADAEEVIGVADGFDLPLVDYVLMRFYQRNTESPTAAVRAKQHQDMFQAAIASSTGAAGRT